MPFPLPSELQQLVVALSERGYAIGHPWDEDADTNQPTSMMLELGGNVPGGRVWIIWIDRNWLVGIESESDIRGSTDVQAVLNGTSPTSDEVWPDVAAQVTACLDAVDQLHGDQAARLRAVAALWPHIDPSAPDPHHPGLAPYDPCWCGSGKRFRLCHDRTA